MAFLVFSYFSKRENIAIFYNMSDFLMSFFNENMRKIKSSTISISNIDIEFLILQYFQNDDHEISSGNFQPPNKYIMYRHHDRFQGSRNKS